MIYEVYEKKTGKKVKLYEIVLESYKAKTWAANLIYCDIEGIAIGEDGTAYVLDECGNYAYLGEEYEVRLVETKH